MEVIKTTKTCAKCKETKDISNFVKNRQQADGLACRCKQCRKVDDKEQYLKNREKRIASSRKNYHSNKETILEKQREKYTELKDIKNKLRRDKYSKNKESLLSKQREYIVKNRERLLAARRARRAKIKDKINLQKREALKRNPYARMAGNLRRRVRTALKAKKHDRSHIEYLGCTVEELRLHIESLFTEGMTWDNHNLHGWHLEHIIGLAMFDLNNPEHLKVALHYKNLRPLACNENLARPKLMTREETKELCDRYGIVLGDIDLKYKE